MAGPYGIQSMLKEGHKHMSGLEEAVLRNIDACKGLAQITRTSLGPNGGEWGRVRGRAGRGGKAIGPRDLVARDGARATGATGRVGRARAGMNKMVINHLEKLFVTSDASTIVSELEVQHPAARMLVMAAMSQQQEIGDGTNLVRPSTWPFCAGRASGWVLDPHSTEAHAPGSPRPAPGTQQERRTRAGR
jgi:T-complex protein 1 subunit theta